MSGSLRELIAGCTKTLASGASLMTPPIKLVRVVLPYLMWLPALFWLVPPILWLTRGSLFGTIATLASLTAWSVVYAAERAPVWYALLYPLGTAFVGFIMVRSAWRRRRLIGWRGAIFKNQVSTSLAARTPPTAPPPAAPPCR